MSYNIINFNGNNIYVAVTFLLRTASSKFQKSADQIFKVCIL